MARLRGGDILFSLNGLNLQQGGAASGGAVGAGGAVISSEELEKLRAHEQAHAQRQIKILERYLNEYHRTSGRAADDLRLELGSVDKVEYRRAFRWAGRADRHPPCEDVRDRFVAEAAYGKAGAHETKQGEAILDAYSSCLHSLLHDIGGKSEAFSKYAAVLDVPGDLVRIRALMGW